MPRLFGRRSEFKFKLYLDDTSCHTSNESLITAYVAVPCRNRTLFCCVFWPCYHVQSTVAQNFRLRAGGSYRVLINGHVISLRSTSPTLKGSSALQFFECGNLVEIRKKGIVNIDIRWSSSTSAFEVNCIPFNLTYNRFKVTGYSLCTRTYYTIYIYVCTSQFFTWNSCNYMYIFPAKNRVYVYEVV